MNKLKILAAIGLFTLVLCSNTTADTADRVSFQGLSTSLVYGKDDRVEANLFADERFKEFARSTAGSIKTYKLKIDPENPEQILFQKTKARTRVNLCSDQRFADQYSLTDCSGFLVAPDVLLTAGHCIKNEKDCRNYKWIFDYNQGTEFFPAQNVYSCKKVLARESYSDKRSLKDYTLIQLDREAEGRKPLKFRTEGQAKIGMELVVIGHPSGLPSKIADGGKISRMNSVEILTPISTLLRKRSYFIANLDTFSGNSGSPVFNKKTGLVEGLLISGATDYGKKSGQTCQSVETLSDSRFQTQEMVFRITQIPELQKAEEQ